MAAAVSLGLQHTERASASLLRRRAARERLENAVGPKPDHPWQAEWRSVVLEEFRLRGYGALAEVAEQHTVQNLEACLAQPIEWLRSRSSAFSATAASCTLLGFCGRAALGRALAARDPCYAACTHVLAGSLHEHAAMLGDTHVAPRAYRNLTGNGGLVGDDPVWASLPSYEMWCARRAADEAACAACGEEAATSGYGEARTCAACGCDRPADEPTRFTTSAVVLADTAESNFESADGYSVLTWAPAPAGGARLEYQLQRDSSIVCFVSGRADGAGYHSLLPTGGTSYSVPPLAQLTLESVEAPGTWQAPCAGKHINQTCYTFSLSYL